jgi:hypothetical protein
MVVGSNSEARFWKQFSIDEFSKKEFAEINVQAIQWIDLPTCMHMMLLIKKISQGKPKVMFALCCMVPSCIHQFMFIGRAVATGKSIKLLCNMPRYYSEFMIHSNRNDLISPWLDATTHTVIMGAPCTFFVSIWIFHSPEMHILFVHYPVQTKVCLIPNIMRCVVWFYHIHFMQ